MDHTLLPDCLIALEEAQGLHQLTGELTRELTGEHAGEHSVEQGGRAEFDVQCSMCLIEEGVIRPATWYRAETSASGQWAGVCQAMLVSFG